VGAVPVVSLLAAKGLTGLVWLLNFIIHFIEELPCSTTRGIYISGWMMLLLYLAIAAGFLFLVRRRTPFLWMALAAVLALSLAMAHARLERLHAGRFVVFNAPRTSLFEFTWQDRAVVFYNSRPLQEWSAQAISRDIVGSDLEAHGIRFRRYIWWGSGSPMRNDRFIPLASAGRFFLFGEKLVFVLDRKLPEGFRGHFRVDYLVLSGNPNVRMEDLERIFNPGMVIIDAANIRSRTGKWSEDAAKLGVPCHLVTMNGAFEKEF
jgi:hypothetical protein